MTATLPIVPAHLMQFMGTLRASAPVVRPADKTPIFTPSQSGSSPRSRRALPEMPELESHDCPMIDNESDCFSLSIGID